MAEIAHSGFFHFAFFPGCARIAGSGIEVVFAGKSEEARVEANQPAVVLGDHRQEIVVPNFPSHASQGLKRVLMTADEGLEALAMGELDKEHAAVGFDQTEGVELSFVALVIERTKVAPIDLEALPRTRLHAHEGGRSGASNADLLQIVAQNRMTAGIASRLETLEDDLTWGAGILLEQFGNQRLERIELAGARTMDRHGHGSLQILFHRAGSQVEMTSDAAHRPMLAAGEPVNFIDLVHVQHGSAYK